MFGGHHTPRSRCGVGPSPRADDALNWIPARLTALLLVPGRLAALRREAGRTPSPNAGWPMGALALALGVRLEKRGVYMLNPSGRAPEPADLHRALARVRRAAALAYALAALLGWGAWGV
ncbi:cobalamin biosynthesis protein [Oceanithermus sp.]